MLIYDRSYPFTVKRPVCTVSRELRYGYTDMIEYYSELINLRPHAYAFRVISIYYTTFSTHDAT